MALGVLTGVLGFRLRRIQNHLATNFSQLLAGRNLRPGEFSALALIAANPGISQIELAVEGGFDKTQLVTLLDDLEAWGWAARVRSTVDRRRHALHITPKGDQELAQLLALAQEAERPLSEALSGAELRNLFTSLDRIYAVCFHNEPL